MEEERRGRSRLGRKGLPPWQPWRDQRHGWHCAVFLPPGEAGGQEAGALQGRGRGGVGVWEGQQVSGGGGAPGGGVAALSGVGIGLFTRRLQGRHPLL